MKTKRTLVKSLAPLLIMASTQLLADNGSLNQNTPDSHVYCPTINEMRLTMCHPQGKFDKEELPFPRCLILLKGKSFVYSSGLSWTISSLSPAFANDTELTFNAAYFNKQGTFCSYNSEKQDLYVRLSESTKNIDLIPTENYNWLQDVAGKRISYATGTFNAKLNYICKPTANIGVKSCPFTVEYNKASSPSQ
jgi:hypothetical protein